MGKRETLKKIRQMSPEEQKQLIMEIEETACSNAKAYHGCSQWTLYALQEHLNLGNRAVFRASSALAGGVAESGEVCGALIGGLMAVGLAYGRSKLESVETSSEFSEAMERSARVCDGFKNEFGSLRCRDVQKAIFGKSWDLRNPEEKNEFLSREDIDKCGDMLIKKVARLVAEVILEPPFS